ncbi:MAG: 2-aminoethylphosphonate--pyruvate transaminase, partial [Burkholderiales bacterium]|nr:2-aminoethylphosphonate--pyruvate transaminase [Burkholderiales bacterium]
ILLTPGPLSTSKSVRAALQKDLCTWDNDYKNLVQDVRKKLKQQLYPNDANNLYTSVLMQGSGTFVVEAIIGSTINLHTDKLLVLSNGVYGERIYSIAKVLGLNVIQHNVGEQGELNTQDVAKYLDQDSSITHVVFVHCETTTGSLNDLTALAYLIKQVYNKTLIVDAMSSLGGIAIDIVGLDIDFIISSANKCIQGIPGFGFVIAKTTEVQRCKSQAKSLSLDLYDQWLCMEKDGGKWRFTSPTHSVNAFHQALIELAEEGGVAARELRYRANHKVLIDGMKELGFESLVPMYRQSPIITTFLYPKNKPFDFNDFYHKIKQQGFVLYPGKVTNLDTFRIGNIGHVFPDDMHRLIKAIGYIV